MDSHVNLTWDAEAAVWIATSDDIPGLALEGGSEEIQRQNQELAAKVAAMEQEDIALGLWDGSSASPSASAGSYNPSRSAKK